MVSNWWSKRVLLKPDELHFRWITVSEDDQRKLINHPFKRQSPVFSLTIVNTWRIFKSILKISRLVCYLIYISEYDKNREWHFTENAFDYQQGTIYLHITDRRCSAISIPQQEADTIFQVRVNYDINVYGTIDGNTLYGLIYTNAVWFTNELISIRIPSIIGWKVDLFWKVTASISVQNTEDTKTGYYWQRWTLTSLSRLLWNSVSFTLFFLRTRTDTNFK